MARARARARERSRSSWQRRQQQGGDPAGHGAGLRSLGAQDLARRRGEARVPSADWELAEGLSPSLEALAGHDGPSGMGEKNCVRIL